MKKLILLLTILFFTQFVAASYLNVKPDVVIFYNTAFNNPYNPPKPDDINVLVNGLKNYGDFGKIDLINWNETPDALRIKDYDVVIVTNMVINPILNQNAPKWGDIIADYADSGGGVVLGSFFFSYAGKKEIGGQLDYGKLDDEGYIPFKTGGTGYIVRTMGQVFIPEHPIMENITTLKTAYVFTNYDNPQAYPGTLVVAVFNDAWKTPLAGERSVGLGRIVGIQGHYTDARFGNTGDFMQLYRNAVIAAYPDEDSDGIKNAQDNCQFNYNPEQEDFDKDGIGDVCDEDIDNDGVLNKNDFCSKTILPESIPIKNLNKNHYADIDGDRIFETKIKKSIVDSQYILTDTYGCSCGQILKLKPGKNNRERKSGCSKLTIEDFIKKKG